MKEYLENRIKELDDRIAGMDPYNPGIAYLAGGADELEKVLTHLLISEQELQAAKDKERKEDEGRRAQLED